MRWVRVAAYEGQLKGLCFVFLSFVRFCVGKVKKMERENNLPQNKNDRTLFAAKVNHLVFIVQFVVLFGLAFFWYTHHYSTDYRRFLRAFFSIEEGFFLSQTFLFVFQAAIFSLINIVSYFLIRGFLEYISIKSHRPFLTAYLTILSVIYFALWALESSRTSASDAYVIISVISGAGCIFFAWLSSLFVVKHLVARQGK